MSSVSDIPTPPEPAPTPATPEAGGEEAGQGVESTEPSEQQRHELQKEMDSRSIYIGNLDYQTTPEELQQFFHDAGLINRITILNDKYTGRPKGYAYIEFDQLDAVQEALKLDGVEFKNRVVKVVAKRTNVPYSRNSRGGFNRGRGGPRGGGMFFRGRGSGGFRGGRGGGGYRGGRSGSDAGLENTTTTSTSAESQSQKEVEAVNASATL